MATEEEAREAADGKEVQVEAVDLEPVYVQTNLDGKLSSMEIKDGGEIIDSTEGKLKIPEDHILVEAPSEIKLPTEHNLNGTSSSLNGHMDEEDKISNEQLHEDIRKDEKQLEAPLDGESTDQSNKINGEVNDSLNHGETTTEDSSLLEHEKEEEPKGEDQQAEDLMQEDTLKTDSDVGQLDQILDPAKATEGRQPSSLANIPDVEVVAEAPAGVQTPVDPSLDDSYAIPDTIDGNTETDEPAKENSDIHLDHRESFPEDTSIAEHVEEVVKIKGEDQQSTQADAMDADVVPEEMPKSEHADESTIEAQEVLNQEPSEETNGPEQDSVETNSTETAETQCVKTAPSSQDDKVEDDVTEAGSTSASQEVDNAGSREEITENIAENIAEVSNVAIVDEENEEKNLLRHEDVAEKHVRGIEPEDTKNIEHVETEEDSDQRHVSLLDDSAHEDNTPACEKQLMESASEKNEIEATRIEAVPEESNVSISEEPSPEHYATENETACDTTEVNITESLEEIEGDKGPKTREISNESNMDSAGKSTQENNVSESEPTSDIQLEQELESEEMKDTELVQVNESSHEINTTAFHKQTQENNPTASELRVMESAGGVSNIEATEVPATPHQFNDDQSEEKATEETTTSTEPHTPEPESVENMNDIVATKPQSISQQSISPFEESVPEEMAKEDNVIIEQDDGHQQPQDLELAEEIVSSSIVSNSEEPTLEDNATVTEPTPETQADNLQSAGVIEDAEYVKSHGALAAETALEENVETEAVVDTSTVQEPELEEVKKTEPVGTEDSITPSDQPEERLDRETVDTEATPQESLVENTIEVTEKDASTAISPHSDIQAVHEQESVEDEHTDTTEKPRETQQIVGSASDELTPTEDNITIAEPACDMPLQNVTAHEIKNSEDAQTDQFCNLDSGPTPQETAQESKLSRIEPTSDVQEMRDLGSTEESRVIEAAETEDHQEYRVSTIEEPAVDKPNVDDQQVHQDRPAEIRDNEEMEAEEVSEQSSIESPENAPEERSELGNYPDCCVQPAQQVEYMSDQKVVTLEDTTTEDSVADEINPSVGEKEYGLESVEEIKDISVNEDKGDFHTGQPDTLDKLASEGNIATTEATSDIQQLNDFEPKEMNSIEGSNEGDISCSQTKTATSVDPSPTDNETASGEHPVEPHEENLGNETDNATMAHGMKDEIQTSVELKDDTFDLGETVPTTKKSNNTTDDDAIQSSGEDKLESSNSNDQIKEEQKTGAEQNSSQMSSEHHGENITHVQDKDINGELITEIGTAEASQAVIGDDTQASQDVTENDDTIKSDEQTSDKRQSDGVEHQLQTCESSVEDEAVQKVSLDEQHKKDEEVESKKEQLQADEQKHEDTRDDVTIKPLLESKNKENGTTMTEETDRFEAEQTEAVVNDIAKNEQALPTSEESTPSITVTTDDYVGTDKGAEEENRPNSANTSDPDAKMNNQEEPENTETGNIGATNSTNEQDENEVGNESKALNNLMKLESGLASSVQEISHIPPPNDHILENDPIAVAHNVESGEHGVDKECINKINDDVLANQESEKAIVAEVQETQNEDKAVHQAESQIKAEEEETSQLHSNEPYIVDNKMDDTTQIADLIQCNATIQPREIEETGETKGLNSISKPVVETSEQNNVEKDLSIHHKVEDGKLESTEDNAVELEATQQKVDASNADTSNDDQLPIINFLAKRETESADDALQLETEGNASHKVDETFSYGKADASNTSDPETVTSNKEIHDKATEAERGMSDESFKTFDDTRRNLDVSSVVTESNEESTNEKIEEHKLDLPAHPTQDENTHEQDMSLSEKPLPTEPEEQEDKQIPKEQDEEDMHEPNFGDDQKEVEQELPVSHFLMNLILGKENTDSNGHSEPEAETKQEETRDDNSSFIIPKQEESLASLPVESNVEYKFPVEQEKKDAKCSEETHEVAEEQIHDLKLGTETSLETDAEFSKSSHNLEVPPYQDNMKDEISNELSEEAAEVVAKMEAKDSEISNIEQNGGKFDTICQENTKATTQFENGSLKNNEDDLTNTKDSEENTLGEGQTGLLPECDDRSADVVFEQTLPLTESGTNAKSSPTEVGSVQNPVSEIHDKTIEATSTPDIPVESEEDKAEQQPAITATGEVAAECVEVSNDSPQKNIVPEATSDGHEPPMAEQVSDTEIALVHEKQISEGSRSTFMDEKEGSNVSVQGLDNTQPAVEIQADGSNMQISQDKQEAADNQTEMEPGRLEESNVQEIQENGTEQKFPKECDDEGQKLLVKEEAPIKEADVHETAESHAETAVETQADGSNMHISQDKQEAADNQTEVEPGSVEESNIRELQENGTGQKYPKECDDEGQKLLVKEEAPIKEADVHETAVETQADGSNMHISQDKQEAADNQTEVEPGSVEESNIRELQENGTGQKYPKECDDEGQELLVKEEALIKEEDVHETDESHAETVKAKSNEEQELSGSKIQERDINVFSPKEAPEAAESFMVIGKPEFRTDEKQSPMAAESFVDTAKPEFSTDEEKSPKADDVDMSEQKTYEGKTKDEDETKNFTDEAMETEARGAGQKATHKKQNLLSGIKHQLAKVKKVITGKPGHKKPESPKS
ncbi:hypothetical protein EJB05_25346 [Eragrostis curvula]|uniref:Uncharacterized protein n=1 Tax=Eragrostis curvula TaxID=38414 RepID=A0A5J9VBR7_9POAL|nr:hypothetical protein EJB05_25346 [Eragrostis curvula]